YEVLPERGDTEPVISAPRYLQTTLRNHLKSAGDFLVRPTRKIPFVIGEMDSGLAGDNNNQTANKQILSNLGTAVWTLDFHLYCIFIGMAGISNQITKTYWKFAPLDTGSMKMSPPLWYGIIAAADFLGNETFRPTRVTTNLAPSPLEHDRLRLLPLYELLKMAFLNLEPWDPIIHPGKQRPITSIQVGHLPPEVHAVQVKKLTGPGGLSTENITWGEESPTYRSEGEAVQFGPGAETWQVELVKQKNITFSIGGTEAVVVSFIR
ncbi:MAG: hypothetical protein Q9181_008183, partial [Wetmoreana brouardii]